MTARIRGAAEEDEAAVVALWRACGLAVGSGDPVRDFHAVRARPASDILVAVDADGVLIGSVAVGYDSNRGCCIMFPWTPRGAVGAWVATSCMPPKDGWPRMMSSMSI